MIKKTCNDPEFIKGMAKSVKKSFRIYRIFGSIPFAIIIWFVSSLRFYAGEMVIPYKILTVYAIFILVMIWFEKRKIRNINVGAWEGTVVKKWMYGSAETHETSVSAYVKVENSDGKTKTVKVEGDIYYHLTIGDRVIVHPNYGSKLELVDKEKYGKRFCSMCGRENAMDATHCYKCGGLLLR